MTDGSLIYVVDDDPDICEVCSIVLQECGYRVETFLTAEAGLAAIREHEPDVLILDVMIEEADSGFRTATALAKTNPNLPILMLSAIARAAGQVFDTSSLPVSELVEKPVSPEDLLARVARLLARRRAPASS